VSWRWRVPAPWGGLVGALGFAVGASAAEAHEEVPVREEVVVADGAAPVVTWLSSKQGPYVVPAEGDLTFWIKGKPGGEVRRAVAGSRQRELGFSAAKAGHFDVELGALSLRVDAVELRALDHRGIQVDASRSHASLSRSLPEGLGVSPTESTAAASTAGAPTAGAAAVGARPASASARGGPPTVDEDALRFLLIGPPSVTSSSLEVLSAGPRGEALDSLSRLALEAAPCPSGVAPELVCRQSAALRAVSDGLERNHPLVRERSVLAVVGGSLRVSLERHPLLRLEVGGPRVTRLGPIERLRARLRVLVLRDRAGGLPAVGGDDAGARRVMQEELRAAAGLWGQCGIELGPGGAVAVSVVDPPTTPLLAVGCGVGLPASGGELRFRALGRSVRLTTMAGEVPAVVAARLAQALGAGSTVFENPRASGDAVPTADVVVTRAAKLAFEPEQPLSTDPTLPLCITGLELGDGLRHFRNVDAFVGTVEERALLRAFDDGDPGTIEVLVVPSFERSERIGESFILTRGGSLSSSVIIDREAIRAGARSFALAHELGHVLLAMPGHPDDFGVDQPWSLMDADAADATLFGPRRLSVAECERALVQSGPEALVPLLERAPLRDARRAAPRFSAVR
jgi:hypothetical protein